MALDEEIAGILQQESVQIHQYTTAVVKLNAEHTSHTARNMSNKKFDEVGATESSAVKKVLEAVTS